MDEASATISTTIAFGLPMNMPLIVPLESSTHRYSADITAGSLKVPETRVIAKLLLQGNLTDKIWQQAIVEENILQKPTIATAIRFARLVRKRLETMDQELWELIAEGSTPVATHAAFAAAVKHSPLLGDFLDLVVRDQYKTFQPQLSKNLWEQYLGNCRGSAPEISGWSESTLRRLRSSVFQTLSQAGYVDNSRNLRLQSVHIVAPVLRYLRARQEKYVLRCLEVSA